MNSKEKRKALAIEEAKYLRLHIEQLAQENAVLPQEVEAQDEAARDVKRTLSNFKANKCR